MSALSKNLGHIKGNKQWWSNEKAQQKNTCNINGTMEQKKKKKRRQATLCEMSARNNGSYAVHISHVKRNDGAMHKGIIKWYKQAIGTQYTETKHACAITLWTQKVCATFTHHRPTTGLLTWTSLWEAHWRYTDSSTYLSSRSEENKNKKSLHNDIWVSQQVLTKVSFYTRPETLSTENIPSNKVNTTNFPWHATSFSRWLFKQHSFS